MSFERFRTFLVVKPKTCPTMIDNMPRAQRRRSRPRKQESADSSAATSWNPADILHRVRGEYLEMPGLRLTLAQAQRLWNLDADSCQAILGNLQQSGFLSRTRDGAFVRADSETGASPVPPAVEHASS